MCWKWIFIRLKKMSWIDIVLPMEKMRGGDNEVKDSTLRESI